MAGTNGEAPAPQGPKAVITIRENPDGLDVSIEFDPPWNRQDEDANPVTHWAALSAMQHVTEQAEAANAQVSDPDEEEGGDA